MFAIIRTGGKQYRVAKDDKLEIEKLEVKDGDKIDFDVLFVSDGKTISTGEPLVKGASVKATVLGQKRIRRSRFSKRNVVRITAVKKVTVRI